MLDRLRLGVAVFAIGALFATSALAAEKFRKLSASQIRSTLAGMEWSDGIHSRDIFGRDGTLTSYGMGRKLIGKWRVQDDQLCLEHPKQEPACHEVWIAGNKLELRRKGSNLPLEGVLQRPARGQ